MRETLKVVASVAIALVLWFAFDGASAQDSGLPEFDPPPVAVAPLEVKMVGVTECAPGWERVSLDNGYTIYYPHPSGHFVPSWVSEAQFVAAFSDPTGRPVEAVLDVARSQFRASLRIICRWTPMRVKASAAD